MLKLNDWKELHQQVRNKECQDCTLCLHNSSICLCGVGPVPAKVMIINESPSLMEDELSRPLNGQSGKLITSILSGLGYPREKVYITHAIKCHTPGNRAPEKTEIKACKKYLEQEIAIVKPQVVITLSNTSLAIMTGHSGITKYRGKELPGIGGVLTIPTFSPGAVLRSPKYMNLLKADITKAINIAMGNKTRKAEPIIHYAMTKESLKELIRDLEKASQVQIMGGCDLETTTFDYWRPETKVMTMGLCVDNIHCWGIPMEHPQSPWRGQTHKLMGYLLPYLRDKIKWIGNNWKYDQKWFNAKYDFKVNFGPDNMLMSYASDENSPHGLKYQGDLWLGLGDYDKEIVWPKEYDPVVDDINLKVKQYMAMNLKTMLKYNAIDAFNSRNVYPYERDRLMSDIRSARIYKHLLENGSHIFTEIEENGMWVDPERLKETHRICQENITKTVNELNALIPEGWCEAHLNKKQLKTGFNWNSTKQLGLLFFGEDGFNFPVILRTEKGAPSTSETVLIELGSEIDHPAINGLGEYRKWAKYMNTYILPWMAKSDKNNRIHPTFKLHGTVTGRLSGEDGVHQVPRDKFIRRLIGAPPGWSFFEIDGSQIELRVVAAIAFEQTMLRVFAQNGDIHRTTAAKVAGKQEQEVSGDERKKAKAVNFGFVYGMGWKKFKVYAWEKYGVRLSDDEAKLFRQRFFELYADLPEWHARMRRIVKAVGYVVSPIGRRRRLPDIYSIDEGMASAAEREAINSPVQGLGSDIVLAAFIDIIRNLLPEYDPNWREYIKPVGAVHDAQYYEIRNDKLVEIATKIKEWFDDQTRLKKWFGYEIPVQILGDCKIGNHWGDAKEWEPGQPIPYEMR